MRITIDRNQVRRRVSGDYVLLPARDLARRKLTVAVALAAWDRAARTRPDDPVCEVEYLALDGRWVSHGTGKVWRVG